MIILLTKTKATGEAVYPIYTFDSVKSWLMALILFPIAAMLEAIMCGLTYLKFKLLNEIDSN